MTDEPSVAPNAPEPDPVATESTEAGPGESCTIDGSLTDKDFYEQGSKFCHQYSELTMKIRMFSQQLLLGYAAAVAIFFANLKSSDESTAFACQVMVGGGGILLLFATVLWLLNHHFSSAFRAIRDRSLIPIEERYSYLRTSGSPKVEWPWQAHSSIRNQQNWRIAWHAPFAALIAVGILSIIVGLRLP